MQPEHRFARQAVLTSLIEHHVVSCLQVPYCDLYVRSKPLRNGSQTGGETRREASGH